MQSNHTSTRLLDQFDQLNDGGEAGYRHQRRFWTMTIAGVAQGLQGPTEGPSAWVQGGVPEMVSPLFSGRKQPQQAIPLAVPGSS